MLVRSLSTLRGCAAYKYALCKRYSSSNPNDEYEVKFYSRPFGLDLKFNEFNEDILVERSAWKDIKIPSVLHKINGKSLNECLTNDAPQEADGDQEIEEDMNKFKNTIRYLQTCALPTSITFKHNQQSASNTFTSSMAPLVELPTTSLYDMTAAEVVDCLQTNWLKQSQIYNKFHANPVFKDKYASFISLMQLLLPNIGNFSAIADRLRNVRELNGKILCDHTIDHNIIYKHIERCMQLPTSTSNEPRAWTANLKDTMIDILHDLDENNIEKIDAKKLFQDIIGKLLFDTLVTLTATRRENIDTAYLYTNKQRILDDLCAMIPTTKNITKHTKVSKKVSRYFKGKYDFMDSDTEDNVSLQSEYWFIVTLLNDFLLFPINYSTEGNMIKKSMTLEDLINKQSQFKYVQSIDGVPLFPHSRRQCLQNKENEDELEVEYIEVGTNEKPYSLRDRLTKFKCNVEREAMKQHLVDKLQLDDVEKIQKIEMLLANLPELNNLTQMVLEQRNMDMMMNEDKEEENVSNMENIDIYLEHLSLWIYNIVEIIRSKTNNEENLFSYLTHERPRELMKNDVNRINKMRINQLAEFISTKISEITNDQNNDSSLANILRKSTTQDALLMSINNFGIEVEELTSLSMEELYDKSMESNCFDDEHEAKELMNWLYCVLHNVHRVQTPIFDKMMQRRNALKSSLLAEDEIDDDIDEAFDEFVGLKESVDDRLYRDANPDWHQYNDHVEKVFVRKFLKRKGFSQHAEKFESMSCLSKLRNRQLRKLELCAKHRKNLMKKVNKWNEIQNIIKYGDKPYYRSNGYEKTSLPSYNQCYGEIGPNKSREFDPKTDQTKATKIFYVPFVNSADLQKLVQKRNFDPAKPL